MSRDPAHAPERRARRPEQTPGPSAASLQTFTEPRRPVQARMEHASTREDHVPIRPKDRPTHPEDRARRRPAFSPRVLIL